eukprot:comp4999_c0_seq1/m.1092 comp4999_c0_seq1/g.1092  ORF comp4999_c0_seq1/g.1092 comp4999_c0_seq1/m.1092 type:complete len:223 (-) comp4999_c0_seq1:408-1076(-)
MFWSNSNEELNIVTVVPITVNVGGTSFHTSRETLRTRGTYFKGLLDQADKSHGRAVESLFVDRDPKYFCLILNYMRTGKLLVEGKLVTDLFLEELHLEAQFYGLADLSSVLTQLKELRASVAPPLEQLDPMFPLYGYELGAIRRKAYVRLFHKQPADTLAIEPLPLPVLRPEDYDMIRFTRAFNEGFASTLNELVSLGYKVEKLEWREDTGLKSFAVLSMEY